MGRYIHLARYLLKAWAKWLNDYPAPKDKEEDQTVDAEAMIWDATTGTYVKRT